MRKKSKKTKKRGPSGWHGRGRRSCGGRREGKEGYCVPSGTGRLTKPTANIQNHASTPVGYGEFKSLREIAVPQGNPGEWVTEVGCRSRRHPSETRQDPDATVQKVSQNPTGIWFEKSLRFMKNLIKIWSGRVPGASRIAPGPFRNTPERRKCKKSIFARSSRRPDFCRGRFWDDFGTRPGP